MNRLGNALRRYFLKKSKRFDVLNDTMDCMERERFADELEEVARAIADDNEEYIEELLNKEEE
jgi:hypothetical protein